MRKWVAVHTPLSREVFWHEYAKIPRHTSQNSIAARQSGMNFGYVTVNGVNSNENGEYLFVKEETFDEFLSLLYHEHTKRK